MAKTSFWVKLGCFLFSHEWDKYLGYYEERVHPDAVCTKCGVKYEDMEW